MPWNDHDGPVPTCTEEQLLAMARAKAAAMGQRRHRQVAAGVLSAILLVVGTVTVLAREESRSDTKLETVFGGPETSTSFGTSTGRNDAAVTSTSTAGVTSTSVAASATTSTVGSRPPPTAPVVGASPSSTATTPSTEPAAASTTTTTLACRNSNDPACGPRVWEPPPGPNQPLTVKVTVTPQAPKAGEIVTFQVVVHDPDGETLQGYRDTVDYGDGTPFLGVGGHVECFSEYGTWDSTARAVHEELSFTHVYQHAGTYTATFKFNTLGNCAYGPSAGTAAPTIIVSSA